MTVGTVQGRTLPYWTKELVAHLSALAPTGMTAAQIGERLGCDRNAVIGKARREGIKLQHEPNRKGIPNRPKASNGVNRPHVPITPYTAAAGTTCKWPLDDFIARVRAHQEPFCGAPARPGSSWCEQHRRRVFVRA